MLWFGVAEAVCKVNDHPKGKPDQAHDPRFST